MLSKLLYSNFSSDYSKGFGGKFGVMQDRQDKSAAGWDHIEKVEKHQSQLGDYLNIFCWFAAKFGLFSI